MNKFVIEFELALLTNLFFARTINGADAQRERFKICVCITGFTQYFQKNISFWESIH
jgi:hypothetical protein